VFIRHIFLCGLCVIFANVAVKSCFAGGKIVHARDLTPEVIGTAIQIHRKLGPGLLESAYEACLAYELQKLRLHVERQRPVPLVYEAVKLDCGFRADLVVENRLVVECKCKEVLHPVDEAQLLSHLRLLNIPVGLLINFHVVLLKDGIRRMVNNYREPPAENL
jgi:GxxExxY protein